MTDGLRCGYRVLVEVENGPSLRGKIWSIGPDGSIDVVMMGSGSLVTINPSATISVLDRPRNFEYRVGDGTRYFMSQDALVVEQCLGDIAHIRIIHPDGWEEDWVPRTVLSLPDTVGRIGEMLSARWGDWVGISRIGDKDMISSPPAPHTYVVFGEFYHRIPDADDHIVALERLKGHRCVRARGLDEND